MAYITVIAILNANHIQLLNPESQRSWHFDTPTYIDYNCFLKAILLSKVEERDNYNLNFINYLNDISFLEILFSQIINFNYVLPILK